MLEVRWWITRPDRSVMAGIEKLWKEKVKCQLLMDGVRRNEGRSGAPDELARGRGCELADLFLNTCSLCFASNTSYFLLMLISPNGLPSSSNSHSLILCLGLGLTFFFLPSSSSLSSAWPFSRYDFFAR